MIDKASADAFPGRPAACRGGAATGRERYGWDAVASKSRTKLPADSRGPKRSTAMVTNISFEAWADYLGDAPLAMAILNRLVDGAIVLKIEGHSYRAHRAQHPATPTPGDSRLIPHVARLQSVRNARNRRGGQERL